MNLPLYQLHTLALILMMYSANFTDQLVVGSVTGRIWIIDPGRASDNKQQLLSCLLEEDLPAAILDIAIANFISVLEQNLIAVLSPQKLTIYRLISGISHLRLTL